MLFLALVQWMDIGTGPFAVVGGFAPGGLNVNNNYDDNENIGVAGLRKSCYFPHQSLKNSVGGGLRFYPTAYHPANLLNHRLNLKILRIIDGTGILCQSKQYF